MAEVFIPWLEPEDDFPDPRQALLPEGLVAAGADLSTARLLTAYDRGLFPWSSEGEPLLWWSPDPRCVMSRERLHVARRLARTMRRRLVPRGGDECAREEGGGAELRLTWNAAFEEVMHACGERVEGTWILPEMLDAYVRLHREGHAHSLEVWRGDDLVGGVYGVQRGGLFAAESMFHRERDASKIALVAAVHTLWRAGIRLFDVQFQTGHLASLGAFEVPRSWYLEQLAEVVGREVDLHAPELVWCDTSGSV